MLFRSVIALYRRGNVSCTGLRGTGKDMLTANVVVRRKKPYISNIDYGGQFYSLDFEKIDCGKNTWREFVSGDVRYYDFPYPMGADIYLSDAGIYLPSQYCNELNKAFPHLAVYQALSRQVSGNNFHFNTQNLNRCWDKIREQSDIYIRCRRCICLFGKFVIQWVTLYDKFQSCQDRVKPSAVRPPLFAKKEVRQQYRIYADTFQNQYGIVRNRLLIYWNRSKYDTNHFRKLLKNGKKEAKK